MAGQKITAAKKDIDRLIQKHDELFDSWRAHRSKSDDHFLDTQGEPEKDCSPKTSGTLEV